MDFDDAIWAIVVEIANNWIYVQIRFGSVALPQQTELLNQRTELPWHGWI
jgi:hypothetical protein